MSYYIYWPEGKTPAVITQSKGEVDARRKGGRYLWTDDAAQAAKWAKMDHPTWGQVQKLNGMSLSEKRKKRQRQREKDRERTVWSKGAMARRNQGHR